MNKKSNRVRRCVLLAGLIWAGHWTTAKGQTSYSVSMAGRYHAENAALPDLPYGDGDWSAMLGLEAREGVAYWQLGVDMAYGAELNSDVSAILTPQLNLLMVDRSIVGGLGILSTYTQDDVLGDNWTDIYYQFSLGFEIPLGKRLKLTALAHDVFADWSKLSEFEFDDLDYSLGVRYLF